MEIRAVGQKRVPQVALRSSHSCGLGVCYSRGGRRTDCRQSDKTNPLPLCGADEPRCWDAMAKIYRKPKIWRTNSIGPFVIGDAPMIIEPQKRRNKSQENAQKRKARPTPAESELEQILNSLNGGVLKGLFFREWAFADKWILDFFFHKIRLGIEVDGSVHSLPSQKQRDREKEKACEEWSITLLRVSNEEVFGNREELLEKLRNAWRVASQRLKDSVYARLES